MRYSILIWWLLRTYQNHTVQHEFASIGSIKFSSWLHSLERNTQFLFICSLFTWDWITEKLYILQALGYRTDMHLLRARSTQNLLHKTPLLPYAVFTLCSLSSYIFSLHFSSWVSSVSSLTFQEQCKKTCEFTTPNACSTE